MANPDGNASQREHFITSKRLVGRRYIQSRPHRDRGRGRTKEGAEREREIKRESESKMEIRLHKNGPGNMKGSLLRLLQLHSRVRESET